MGTGSLGELESLVLLAVARLGDRAYGVGVRDEIERRTGRALSRGAIYTVLKRLEDKGCLVGSLGAPTRERGGRARRYLRLTDSGLGALRGVVRDFDRMRQGLDLIGET